MFNASDLDGSKSLEYYEFYIMLKLIEPQKFSFKNACELFRNYSEVTMENDQEIPVIKFNQFLTLCEAEHLFSEQ